MMQNVIQIMHDLTFQFFISACPLLPHAFLRNKKKKGKQRKKERVSKQRLLKGCHQGQNVTVLAILECLEFKNPFRKRYFWKQLLLKISTQSLTKVS